MLQTLSLSAWIHSHQSSHDLKYLTINQSKKKKKKKDQEDWSPANLIERMIGRVSRRLLCAVLCVLCAEVAYGMHEQFYGNEISSPIISFLPLVCFLRSFQSPWTACIHFSCPAFFSWCVSVCLWLCLRVVFSIWRCWDQPHLWDEMGLPFSFCASVHLVFCREDLSSHSYLLFCVICRISLQMERIGCCLLSPHWMRLGTSRLTFALAATTQTLIFPALSFITVLQTSPCLYHSFMLASGVVLLIEWLCVVASMKPLHCGALWFVLLVADQLPSPALSHELFDWGQLFYHQRRWRALLWWCSSDPSTENVLLDMGCHACFLACVAFHARLHCT